MLFGEPYNSFCKKRRFLLLRKEAAFVVFFREPLIKS